MHDRRDFLKAVGASTALWLLAPRATLAAAGTDKRFVFVLLRGAADGLDTLIPYADPGYERLRGGVAVESATALRLDGSFALHPSLTETARLYGAGEALFVHAVASPYRDRSHFDGQNVLETGGATPYGLKDGWLNRLVAQVSLRPGREAIAFTPTMPMALRGKAEVASYVPLAEKAVDEGMMAQVARLYEHDRQLHPLWASAMETREMAMHGGNAEQRIQNAAGVGKVAASFLSRVDGPQVAMIEMGGWDTHYGQKDRLARQLKALDALVASLQNGMAATWSNTVVLVATEFGRTAAANGSGGTDHGTASAAMLLGGAVRGGRILTDWPGLDPAQLYEGRDVKPTADLNTLIASAAGECFGIEPQKLARNLFPQGLGLPGGAGKGLAMPDLLRKT